MIGGGACAALGPQCTPFPRVGTFAPPSPPHSPMHRLLHMHVYCRAYIVINSELAYTTRNTYILQQKRGRIVHARTIICASTINIRNEGVEVAAHANHHRNLLLLRS